VMFNEANTFAELYICPTYRCPTLSISSLKVGDKVVLRPHVAFKPDAAYSDKHDVVTEIRPDRHLCRDGIDFIESARIVMRSGLQFYRSTGECRNSIRLYRIIAKLPDVDTATVTSKPPIYRRYTK